MTKLISSLLAIALLAVTAVYFFFRPEEKKQSDRRRVSTKVNSLYQSVTAYTRKLFLVKNPQEPEVVRAAAA
jgi:hypothetical protein